MGRLLLFADELNDILQTSAGIAFAAGAIGTLLRMVFDHQQWIYNTMGDTPWSEFLASAAKAAASTTNSFKFFPIFLMIGFLKYKVDRWQSFINYGTNALPAAFEGWPFDCWLLVLARARARARAAGAARVRARE